MGTGEAAQSENQPCSSQTSRVHPNTVTPVQSARGMCLGKPSLHHLVTTYAQGDRKSQTITPAREGTLSARPVGGTVTRLSACSANALDFSAAGVLTSTCLVLSSSVVLIPFQGIPVPL